MSLLSTVTGTATYHAPVVINYGWGAMSWLGVAYPGRHAATPSPHHD